MKIQALVLPKLSDNKEYVEAEAKLTNLRLELVEAEKKKNFILGDLNSPIPRHNPIHEAAQKMLEGDLNPITPDASKKLLEGYAELGTRITVIQTAIKMQEKIVGELRAAASVRAEQLVQPIHREHVRKVVEKLKELDEALAAETDLRFSLFEEGFQVNQTRHMSINSLGLIRNPHSNVSLYLLEAYREGFISQSELPENLQKTLPPAPAAKKPVMQAIKAKFDDWTAA